MGLPCEITYYHNSVCNVHVVMIFKVCLPWYFYAWYSRKNGFEKTTEQSIEIRFLSLAAIALFLFQVGLDICVRIIFRRKLIFLISNLH